MGFILKFVVILFIFAFVVYVLKAAVRLSHNLRSATKELLQMRDAPGQRGPIGSTQMVRCAACGSFVAARDALNLSKQGRSVSFCSTECIQAHVKSA